MTQQSAITTLVDEKKASIIKWVLIAALCFAAAPLALVLLKGVVALGVAAGAAVAGIFGAPYVARKASAFKHHQDIQTIKDVVQDAKENPIENLQNEFLQSQKDVAELEEKLKVFMAQVANFAQQTEVYKKKYPADTEMFNQQLAAYQGKQAFKEEQYKKAVTDLKLFEDVVNRAKDMFEMAKITERLDALDGSKSEDVFARIRIQTSFDVVRQKTFESIAAARIAVMKGEVPTLSNVSSTASLAAPQQPQTIGLIGNVKQPQPVVNQ